MGGIGGVGVAVGVILGMIKVILMLLLKGMRWSLRKVRCFFCYSDFFERIVDLTRFTVVVVVPSS